MEKAKCLAQNMAEVRCDGGSTVAAASVLDGGFNVLSAGALDGGSESVERACVDSGASFGASGVSSRVNGLASGSQCDDGRRRRPRVMSRLPLSGSVGSFSQSILGSPAVPSRPVKPQKSFELPEFSVLPPVQRLPLFHTKRGLPKQTLSIHVTAHPQSASVAVVASLDTGCSHTLLREDVWLNLRRHGCCLPLSQYPHQIMTAAGIVSARGLVYLVVTFGGKVVEEPVLVVATLPEAMLASRLMSEALGLLTIHSESGDGADVGDASFDSLLAPIEATGLLAETLEFATEGGGAEDLLEEVFHDVAEGTGGEVPRVSDDCPEQFRAAFNAVLAAAPGVYRKTPPPVPADFEPAVLEMHPDAATKLKFSLPHPSNPVQKQAYRRIIAALLANDIIETTTEKFGASALLVAKTGPSAEPFRLVVSFKDLNSYVVPMDFPMEKIPDLLSQLTDDRVFFSTVDLSNAYYSVAVAEESRRFLTFNVRLDRTEQYRFKRLPQGLNVSPAHFSSRLFFAFQDLIGRNEAKGWTLCVYVDDLGLSAKTPEALAELTAIVLARLHELHLFVNPAKMVACSRSVRFLGHLLSANKIALDPQRIEAVQNLRPPRDARALRKAIGLFSWLSSHVRNARIIMAPLQHLLRSEVRWHWNLAHQLAFDRMKAEIAAAPGLCNIDYTSGQRCVIRTDASNAGVGAYLAQEQDGELKPIAFLSHAFTRAESSWPAVQREAFAVVLAVQKWRRLLIGLPATLVETDAKALTSLKDSTNAKIQRWFLTMSELPLVFAHVRGEENPIADFISRAFVARPEFLDKLELAHGSVTGHYGVKATVRRLMLADVSWPTMHQDVEQYVSNCPFCQRHRPFVPPVTLPKVINVAEPFDEIAIDTFGPMPMDRLGNTYVILFVDVFSRYVWLYPAPDASAASAARGLLQVVGHFGVPSSVRSDAGSQFTAKLISDFLELLNVKHQFGLIQRPQSNGQAERMIGMVRRQMVILSAERRFADRWSDLLPIVQWVVNSEISSVTGVAPIQMLMPSITPWRQVFHRKLESSEPAAKPVSEFLEEMVDFHDKLVRGAQRKQQAVIEQRLQPPSSAPIRFDVGDYVLMSYAERPPNKLAFRLSGPYRIVAVEHDNVYTLDDVLEPGKVKKVHASRLVKFKMARTEDPRVIACADSRNFVIDHIAGHNVVPGTRLTRGGLELKVKWLGLPVSETTWLPLAAVRHTQAWVDYRARHVELARFA